MAKRARHRRKRNQWEVVGMRKNIDAMICKLNLSDDLEKDLRDLVKSLVNNPDVVDGRRIKKLGKEKDRQYWRARAYGESHFYRMVYYLKPYRKMVIVTKIDHRETVYQGSLNEKFRRIPIFRQLPSPFLADLMRYDRPDSSRSLH